MLWSDINVRGKPGLLVLEAEFLDHVTSPKGWMAALCKFNQHERASAAGTNNPNLRDYSAEISGFARLRPTR